MREIRFRFWSGSKMFYDLDNVMECLKQQIAYDLKLTFPIPYDHVGEHGSNFMQFTGLKDKNGIEIYFNDLVKAPSGLIFEVIWHEEEMRIALMHRGAKYNSIYNFNVPLYEVIGNIYQKPELL